MVPAEDAEGVEVVAAFAAGGGGGWDWPAIQSAEPFFDD